MDDVRYFWYIFGAMLATLHGSLTLDDVGYFWFIFGATPPTLHGLKNRSRYTVVGRIRPRVVSWQLSYPRPLGRG